MTSGLFLARPVAVSRSRRWPDRRTDIDKLVRAVLDALTTDAMFEDDARDVHVGASGRTPTVGGGRAVGVTVDRSSSCSLNRRAWTTLVRCIVRIPAIMLKSDTSEEGVATVCEKVNTGGLSLNVFEVLTAKFAGEKKYFGAYGTNSRLGEDWDETVAGIGKYPVLSEFKNTNFLQAAECRTDCPCSTSPCAAPRS